jgi:hypothetical protein
LIEVVVLDDGEGIEMRIKKSLKSQYRASLEMLKQAIGECPESLWYSTEYKNPFWHTAFHVLFYTHFYLQPSEGDFVPWKKHMAGYVSLASAEEDTETLKPYNKDDLLEYLELSWEEVEEQVNRLDLDAESGFHWLPFDKLELQIYNIRHLMQHTGELYERLGAKADIEVRWVGMQAN